MLDEDDTYEFHEEYLQECKSMFNDIGLYGDTDICRLVGYAEDEDDCYYKTVQLGGKIVYASMVIGFYSLKNVYPRYKQLENSFLWNGSPPEENFVAEHIK